MVIRRVREHVASHNWFAVFIDLVIVVVGVFLGTQANNWNEARIERSDAADYRHEIIDDLVSRRVLARDEDGLVALGPRLLHYGLAYRQATPFLAVAQREMLKLALVLS